MKDVIPVSASVIASSDLSERGNLILYFSSLIGQLVNHLILHFVVLIGQ